MRLALEGTDGVDEMTLVPMIGSVKVVSDRSVQAEDLLDIINAEDVTDSGNHVASG